MLFHWVRISLGSAPFPYIYPASIRQTEKPAQGRGKGKGQSAAILPSVGHLQLITTLKTAADCCHLCQYNPPKHNLTYPYTEE